MLSYTSNMPENDVGNYFGKGISQRIQKVGGSRISTIGVLESRIGGGSVSWDPPGGLGGSLGSTSPGLS